MTRSNNLLLKFLSLVLCATAACPSEPAQVSNTVPPEEEPGGGQALLDDKGNLFMEEVEPAKPKPKPAKIPIDLSRVGVSVDGKGRIIPLKDESGVAGVKPFQSRIETSFTALPQPVFYAPVIVPNYGYGYPSYSTGLMAMPGYYPGLQRPPLGYYQPYLNQGYNPYPLNYGGQNPYSTQFYGGYNPSVVPNNASYFNPYYSPYANSYFNPYANPYFNPYPYGNYYGSPYTNFAQPTVGLRLGNFNAQLFAAPRTYGQYQSRTSMWNAFNLSF